MNPLLIAYLILCVIAVADAWVSRLSTGAKVLWTLVIVFLVVVGPGAWIITRNSAHQPLEDA